MQVELKLFATLARFLPAGPTHRLEIEAGDTVNDLLRRLKVPDDQVKLIFVDGVRVRGDTPLRDGSRVGVFPPVGGG